MKRDKGNVTNVVSISVQAIPYRPIFKEDTEGQAMWERWRTAVAQAQVLRLKETA